MLYCNTIAESWTRLKAAKRDVLRLRSTGPSKTVSRVGRHITAVAMCASLAGWASATAKGDAIPLPQGATLSTLIGLNSSGGVKIGSLVFSDFSYTATTFNPANPTPSSSQIMVSSAPGQNTGLTFASLWEAVPGGNQDGLIRYAVQSTAGPIDQVQLGFNGAAPLAGLGTFASVTESVSTLLTTSGNVPIGPGVLIGQLSTLNSAASGSTTTNNAVFTLASPQAGLYISKDIAVAAGVNGIATISFVDNTCHIIDGPSTPEPVSLGVFGAIGVGIMARRRH